MPESKKESQIALPGVDLSIPLSTDDFRRGRLLHQTEERVLATTRAQLFPTVVYTLLSATEVYEKQRAVFEQLMRARFDTPEAILANQPLLGEVTRQTRFPGDKFERLIDLAKWWQETDLPDQIVGDSQDSRTREFELRSRVARETPGLGWKCASYLLVKLDYDNVVPIDTWMCRYLASKGVRVRLPDYEHVSGPMGLEYLRLEAEAQRIAREEYGSTPADLQRAVWVKMHQWHPRPNGVAVSPQLPLHPSFVGPLQGRLPF